MGLLIVYLLIGLLAGIAAVLYMAARHELDSWKEAVAAVGICMLFWPFYLFAGAMQRERRRDVLDDRLDRMADVDELARKQAQAERRARRGR